MYDVNAFEHQVADEALRIAGPSEPVDDLAIFNHIITAIPSPKWRFQTMFSATKFVVAGAIVALFGGFLLSGVLTQRSQESVPVVGASASASVQADPTGETTPEVKPSPEADATETSDATIRSDLIPGVDLEVEEVRPGIYRVLSDGEHDLRTNVWDVEITPSGEVWVEKHRVSYEPRPKKASGFAVVSRDGQVLRLGEKGAPPAGELTSGKGMNLSTRNGQLTVTASGGRRTWDGERWLYQGPACYYTVRGPDGGCWYDTYDPEPTVFRVEYADGTERMITRDDIGIGADISPGPLMQMGEDGIIRMVLLAGATDGGPTKKSSFAGLAAYDGNAWTLVPPADIDIGIGRVWSLGTTPDGIVWVGGQAAGSTADDPRQTVWNWDGDTWAVLGTLPRSARGGGFHLAPGGNVWVGALDFFDGTALRQLELPRSASAIDPRLGSFAYGVDGSVWLTVVDDGTSEPGCQAKRTRCRGVTDGLYVITPEAVAASE